MTVVNLTIELADEEESRKFDSWIREYVTVKDYKIIPDTKELYKNDSFFKKIVDANKKAKRTINRYINDHN
jgi:hypothetical protein